MEGAPHGGEAGKRAGRLARASSPEQPEQAMLHTQKTAASSKLAGPAGALVQRAQRTRTRIVLAG